MTPPLTLERPVQDEPECRALRAVGNDGLTDVEREEYAWRYKSQGPGQQPSKQELRDVAAWLKAKRGPSPLV